MFQCASPKRSTFAASASRTGGTAAVPLVYSTREFPTQIKDFTEIWYDVNAPGKDERGEAGNGMMMKVSLIDISTRGHGTAAEQRGTGTDAGFACAGAGPVGTGSQAGV